MPTIYSNVDWSATAAWIALAISIVGTIASPLITSCLNNRHQRKMYKLKSEDRRIDKINDSRISTLKSFITNTGKCISHTSVDNISDFGSSFFSVYQYIPCSRWVDLDKLYRDIINNRWDDARTSFLEISHLIAELLKEPLL